MIILVIGLFTYIIIALWALCYDQYWQLDKFHKGTMCMFLIGDILIANFMSALGACF